MLEYYMAIVHQHRLGADARTPKVHQVVFLIAGASDRAYSPDLQRDGIRFKFQTFELSQLDPSRSLLQSQLPYEAVLGLLCIEQVHNTDWSTAIEVLTQAGRRGDDSATDAAALLLLVAQLLRAPAEIAPLIRRVKMDFELDESSILGEFIAEREEKAAERAAADATQSQARDILREMLEEKGFNITERMEDLIETMTTSELRDTINRVFRGASAEEAFDPPATFQPGD